MPESPPNTTAAKIQKLLDELVAQHGLDDDACAELRSHLEEKVAGYLRGEVRITDDDAILLARSHFGNEHEVAAMLARESRSGVLGIGWPMLPSFSLATAVVLLATIFGLIVPLFAYVSVHLQTTFKADWPLVQLVVVQTSPWMPLLVALLGSAMLLVKERVVSTYMALRINVAMIAASALFGGILCFLLWLPILNLMRALPD